MSVNVIEKYVNFSEKNIIQYARIILDSKYEKYLVQEFCKFYIDAYFYQLSGDLSVKQYLKNKVSEIEDTTLYYESDVQLNYDAVKLAIELDQKYEITRETINRVNEFRKEKLKTDELISETNLLEKLKEAIDRKKDFLQAFQSEYFELAYDDTSKKNLYWVEIKHHIKFPELYSEFAIKKAFNRDLINEQKMFVIYYLLSIQIIKDLHKRELEKEYLVNFDYTIFEKKMKSKRLLDIVDNEIAKDKISFILPFEEYLKNTDDIKDMIKEGYNFAILIDDKYEDNPANNMMVKLFKYIIIVDDKYHYDGMKSNDNIVKI